MDKLSLDKRILIADALREKDWSYGDANNKLTRADLIQYIMEQTAPIVNKKGVIKKRPEKMPCLLCGKPTAPYTTTLTRRNVCYLLGALWLSNDDIKKGGDGFIHHDIIHDFVVGKFEHDKGKNKGKGINFTSYGTMTRHPWDFLEPRDKEKGKSDGCFRPTKKCKKFLRGEVMIPESIDVMDATVVRYADKLIYAHMAKDVNFKQLLELYRTF